MAGRLAIVPTPVGNLSDMSPRAVETLREASLVLAEDTRTSGVLLRHFGISTPMASHHKYNEHKPLDAILDRIAAGETIALVSDAGTPGISDPGFMLARECRRRGLVVETLPGPPLRTARALAELAEACGGTRPAAVAREISKVHETIHRGTLDELAGFFAVNQPKGEIVIVVAGKERPDAAGRRHRNKYRSDDTAGEPRDD